MKNPPRVKTGQKINLIQVTGTSKISGYVNVPIFFDSDTGPVQIDVEAYVVKGMATPIILGNDFADQYSISLIREGSDSFLVFGNTGRKSKIESSVSSPLQKEDGNIFNSRALPNQTSLMAKFKLQEHIKELRKPPEAPITDVHPTAILQELIPASILSPGFSTEVIPEDSVMKIPQSNGFNSIPMVVDKSNKFAIYPKNTVDKEATELIFDYVPIRNEMHGQAISHKDSRRTIHFLEIGSLFSIQGSSTIAEKQAKDISLAMETALCAHENLTRDWASLLNPLVPSFDPLPPSTAGFAPTLLILQFAPSAGFYLSHPSSSPTAEPTDEKLTRSSRFSSDSRLDAPPRVGVEVLHAAAVIEKLETYSQYFQIYQAAQQPIYSYAPSVHGLDPRDHLLSLGLQCAGAGTSEDPRLLYDKLSEIFPKLDPATRRISLPLSYRIHSVQNLVPRYPLSASSLTRGSAFDSFILLIQPGRLRPVADEATRPTNPESTQCRRDISRLPVTLSGVESCGAMEFLGEWETYRSQVWESLQYALAVLQGNRNQDLLVHENNLDDLVSIDARSLNLSHAESGKGKKFLPRYGSPSDMKLDPATNRIVSSTSRQIHPVLDTAHRERCSIPNLSFGPPLMKTILLAVLDENPKLGTEDNVGKMARRVQNRYHTLKLMCYFWEIIPCSTNGSLAQICTLLLNHYWYHCNRVSGRIYHFTSHLLSVNPLLFPENEIQSLRPPLYESLVNLSSVKSTVPSYPCLHPIRTLLLRAMASFPEISALDFSLTRSGGSFIQAPVEPLIFDFQYSSNFDVYKPCDQDFYFLDSPVNHFAVLRSDLASCYWESLKMKGRYILAAAAGSNDGTVPSPLPATIPEEKLLEIGMIAPPFPPVHQLTYNFLLLPESPEKIREWIELWQQNSRQLAAWIAQAKVQTARLPSSTWTWPIAPHLPYPVTPISSLDSPQDSPSHVTVSEDGTGSDPASSGRVEPNLLFNECPEPPSELSHRSLISTHSNPSSSSGRVARAFRAELEKDILKRVRDSSPVDPLRDGSESNKKQLVLWRPTIAKVLEMRAALRKGEVPSHSTRSSSNPILNTRVRDPRLRISLLSTDRATGSVTLTKPVDGSANDSGEEELFGKV